jgi:hypothetical protein
MTGINGSSYYVSSFGIKPGLSIGGLGNNASMSESRLKLTTARDTGSTTWRDISCWPDRLDGKQEIKKTKTSRQHILFRAFHTSNGNAGLALIRPGFNYGFTKEERA